MLSQLSMEKGKVEKARQYWKRITEIDIPAHDAVAQKLVREAKKQLSNTSAVDTNIEDKGLLFNLGIK